MAFCKICYLLQEAAKDLEKQQIILQQLVRHLLYVGGVTKENGQIKTMKNNIADRKLPSKDKNRNQTILISVLGILILFFLKTIFVIYVSYRNNRFIQNFTKEMLVKLLKNFFKEDYYSFIERNSGKFYRNFDAEIRNFAHFFENFI